MARYWVGLDVHSSFCAYTVQDSSGEIIKEGTFETTPKGFARFASAVGLPAETPVGLETGTAAFFAARQLALAGFNPVVIDAHEVRLKAQRPGQKSDRRDAFEICDGLRRNIYRTIVYVPPLSVSALRETLSRRRHFVRLKTAEVNAAKRLLRTTGRAGDARSLGTRMAWDLLITRIGDDPSLLACVELHRQTWRHADEQVQLLDKRLEDQAQEFSRSIELLCTIPGVGRIVALTAVAVYGDVSRFPGAKQAASYAGLVPTTHQSGDRDTHGHITKRGSSELRAMLCEAAQHARKKEHPLHPFFASVCAKRGHKVAMVSIAHRLARMVFAMLRDAKPFDERVAGVEYGPFTYNRTVDYRRATG